MKKLSPKICQNWTKSSKESCSIYIYKVMKQVHPDADISSRAMGIMDLFVSDIFKQITSGTACLAHCNKSSTTISLEIQTAVYLLLPGKLATHVVLDGTTLVTKYTGSNWLSMWNGALIELHFADDSFNHKTEYLGILLLPRLSVTALC
ncbi:late histone H2B.L4-like [Stegostoma tigrinum]|uniref:late histone H2B.L4-like n=1 Tax=Stegostoma tigrinum TaxID=3053191 RepID=UPI0028709186|nr:late histone H2B.L4-like [Stegostoma tigrinum]